MLAIRFNRTGKRNHASFRVVLQEHTKAPGKRHVELLGSYDPHKKTTILKKERILYWIGQGAQTSPVVTNLLIREGVIEGKKVAKKMPRPVVKEEIKAEEAPVVAEEVKAPEAPVVPEAKTEEAPVQSETPAPAEVAAPAEAVVAPAQVEALSAEAAVETTPVVKEASKT